VQNFYPSPMANATTIYHTELNSLKNVKHTSEIVTVPKGGRQRKLHKALLRYHDPAGWTIIREALIAMGKEKLIGNSLSCLVPAESRQEREVNRSKGKSKGAISNPSAATKEQGEQKAFTRFSEDQFADRKPKSKGGKPSTTAKQTTGKAAGGQGNTAAPSKQRPAKKNVWGTTPKHQR
jgi:hypothetical protein